MGQTRKGMKKGQKIRRAKRKNPSTNVKQMAACDGKQRWGKQDRETALAKYPKGAVKFYKCQFCRWFHVGRAVKGVKW